MRTLLAVAGLTTLVSTVSVSPAQAAAPYCSILAIAPWVPSGGGTVVATGSASCYGPVYGVNIITRLYKFSASWHVYAEKKEYWGTVASNRNGSISAWGAASPASACIRYMTQTQVNYKLASGTPYSNIRYSDTVWRSGAGPCTLP
ncbi:MAG TPA: hypothetical protein VFV66_22820 [Nonomuraea sp.]|nr:hypothetical protein [Nonomuraea sp.]